MIRPTLNASIAVLTLVLSISAHADDAFNKAVGAVAQDVKPKLWQHQVLAFNYFHADHVSPSLNFANISGADLEQHLQGRIDAFENPEQKAGSDFGEGLYIAFDPVTTQDYGRPNFGLMVLTIPQNTIYLDFTGPNPLKPETMAAVHAAGCNIKEADLIVAFKGEQNVEVEKVSDPNCRKIAVAALKQLKVKFFLYNYWTYRLDGCTSYPEADGYAAVVTDPVIFSGGNFKAFSNQVFDESVETRQLRTAVERLSRSNGERKPLWPTLQVGDLRDPKWTRQNLLYCM